ncbi:hypothetical protein vseg_013956 [Gypsophila vaccaria]
MSLIACRSLVHRRYLCYYSCWWSFPFPFKPSDVSCSLKSNPLRHHSNVVSLLRELELSLLNRIDIFVYILAFCYCHWFKYEAWRDVGASMGRLPPSVAGDYFLS